jgi:hypothetical protein
MPPFLKAHPDGYPSKIPDSLKSDKACIQEFLKNDFKLFLHLDEKNQTKENYIFFIENCKELRFDLNYVPDALKNDPNLMEFCLKRNPKNLIFFSPNNEFTIYGIVNHIHAYMIDYLQNLDHPFNLDSFHQWYLNQFNVKNLNLSKDKLVWKKIEMELNRFYLILLYDDQNIKNLNDIKFEFF